MNKVILSGHLTKDIELSSTSAGVKRALLNIATDNGKDKDGNKRPSDFHTCVCWGRQAEIMAQYLDKGAPITVEGKLETKSYEKNGEKKYYTEVRVLSFEFPPHRGKQQTGSQSTDDDIPFASDWA